MKKTKVGKVNQEGNASFVAIYAKGFKPWANNLELSEEQQNTEVPIVLMLNRWDGRVGFIGGNVDNEESLIEAALRESKEEINLSNVNESDLEPIVTHNFKAGSKTLSTHLFVKEVSLEEFSKIQNEIPNSKEFGVEVMGSNKVLIGDSKLFFTKIRAVGTKSKTEMPLVLVIEINNPKQMISYHRIAARTVFFSIMSRLFFLTCALQR